MIKEVIKDTRDFLKERSARKQRQAHARKYSEFTMTPVHIAADNLLIVEDLKSVEGCVVECGVWRGGMSAMIADLLGPDRSYYLYDSFEGLPPAKVELDGQKAIDWMNDTDSKDYLDNCSAEPEFAERAMKMAGATSFKLIEGWFEDTIAKNLPSEPIALLRVDGDWYDSTMTCLQELFPLVQPGGIIIMDDYFAWDGCSRALHDYLGREERNEKLRHVNSVCYLKKL